MAFPIVSRWRRQYHITDVTNSHRLSRVLIRQTAARGRWPLCYISQNPNQQVFRIRGRGELLPRAEARRRRSRARSLASFAQTTSVASRLESNQPRPLHLAKQDRGQVARLRDLRPVDVAAARRD